MDAIPSLCASSASCAIGALGYALGHSKSLSFITQSQQTSADTALDNLPTAATPSPTPGYSSTFPRNRPATSPQPFDPYKRSSTLSGLDEGGERRSLNIQEHFSGLHSAGGTEEIRKRSSWYRRFSTITPSIDGSVGSPSIQQPSTPSVFSNGSSATPFFGQPISTVTPPNKLVKRSTSYKGLPSEYTADSPFNPTIRGPTFRRPATSHQRSETLRLRHVRQNLATFDESTERHSETWSRKRDRLSIVENPNPGSSLWHPFFQFQQKRFAGDPGSRRTSGSKFFGGTDHITSITTPIGGHATLVKGNRVDKPKVDLSRTIDPLMEESANMDDHFDELQALDSSVPKSKLSVSAEIRRQPSLPRKLIRGNSLRKSKPQDTRAAERRIVSAPMQPIKSPIGEEMTNDENKIMAQSPPSPLPKLETLSAFEIDLHRPDSSNRGSGPDTSFDQLHISKVDNVQPPQPTQHRLQPTSRTGSRVPSDKSTAYGSDTENNRVFSVDGDDTDYRSETYYDSLRTDASGSSHSGARNYRAEHVFGEHKTQDTTKTDLSTLREKLSATSLEYIDDDNGEEDSVETPTWRSRLKKEETSTSSDWSNNAINTANFTAFNGVSSPEHVDVDSSDEGSWDDELGIDSSVRVIRSLQPSESRSLEILSTNLLEDPDPDQSNEVHTVEYQDIADVRPKTSHQLVDRGGRSSGRRPTNNFHVRSQSVPLPPDNSKHKFNNAKKLDNWVLGNKGVSEDWDNDFEFDEGLPDVAVVVAEDVNKNRPATGIVIPREILDRQATVHGQFGQVKELTLLVEQLRSLYQSATDHSILDGQSSELWKEAAGIIDLATLDEEESEVTRSSSPVSTSFDLDNFDDESIAANLRRTSNTYSSRSMSSSPNNSRHGTPQNRPKSDSVARAKNVLANIHQHRDPLDPPIDIGAESVSPTKAKKMPFDTTSLRDLVTRAGVVTRACKEIIRRIEDPDYVPHTPERRPTTPPNPPFFSQLFQSSPTPSSPSAVNHRSARTVEKVSFSTPSTDQKVHGHNVSMMTVV